MPESAAKTMPKPAQGRPAEGALEGLIGYHLRRASLADLAGVSAVLAGAQMRPVPLSVFTKIVERPGITAAEICRELAIQRANIVPILAELEARGFFVREQDAKDQRVQRLYATKAGRTMHADCIARIGEHEERLLGRLTQTERESLRELLEKVWRD